MTTRRKFFPSLVAGMASLLFLGQANAQSRAPATSRQWSGGLGDITTTPFVKVEPWNLNWEADAPIEILVYHNGASPGNGTPIMTIQQAESGVGTAHISTVGHFQLRITSAGRWRVQTSLAR